MSQEDPLKHLPEPDWPLGEGKLFAKAFTGGDIFDDNRGAGANLSERTRRTIIFGWRRWLGFLSLYYPADLRLPAADRITPIRVRAYVENLGTDMRPSSVAMTVTQLYNGARLIAPDRDWGWLKALKRRLLTRATPEDRFGRLVSPHQILDLGITLMDTADTLPATGQMQREIQFRDGLILAILSLWPIRRRSLAALTVDRHVKSMPGDNQLELLLFPEDTKAHRMESWPVPDLLAPYMHRYLEEVRPRLTRLRNHDALWVGQHDFPLSENGLYAVACRRTEKAFGTAMAPHDIRRSAATSLAMDTPEMVGLTPGVLQHVSPETSARYYNLSRSISASRRYSAALSRTTRLSLVER